MNKPLTESAARIMQKATNESVRLHHGWLGTEHVLLGLTFEPGAAADVLKRFRMTPAKVRS